MRRLILLNLLALSCGFALRAAEDDLFSDPEAEKKKPATNVSTRDGNAPKPAAAKPGVKSIRLKPAETIEIPDETLKTQSTAPKAAPAAIVTPDDDVVRAEIVPLPPLKKPIATPVPPAAPSDINATVLRKGDGAYRYLLSGALNADLTLGPEHSPLAITGALIVPANLTLTIRAGTVIHLLADPRAQKPAEADAPDPTVSAAIWVWGTLLAEGITGNPIELLNQEKSFASLLLYGNTTSKLEGTRLKDVAVAQHGGIVYWTNCELLGARHFALASGAALLTHCSLRDCGGIFATYNAGPWSLFVRRCLFDRCKEGVVLGSDPGEARLIIEKNHFLGTRGAHIRAMPVAPVADSKGKPADLELLIGENWYGTAMIEEIDLRLVDRRSDPTLRARLNTRPPADQPYPTTGAGVTAPVLAASLKDQLPAQQKFLLAHPQLRPAATKGVSAIKASQEKTKAPPEKQAAPAAMQRSAKKP